MFKCECGKEVKTEFGLKRHKLSCKNIPIEIIDDEITDKVVLDEVVESKESISQTERGVIQQGELTDNIKRKIKKLRDLRKSTWDAEQRHNIDLQIKELEG